MIVHACRTVWETHRHDPFCGGHFIVLRQVVARAGLLQSICNSFTNTESLYRPHLIPKGFSNKSNKTLNLKKCTSFTDRISYLEQVVHQGHLGNTNHTTNAISNIKIETTQIELECCIFVQPATPRTRLKFFSFLPTTYIAAAQDKKEMAWNADCRGKDAPQGSRKKPIFSVIPALPWKPGRCPLKQRPVIDCWILLFCGGKTARSTDLQDLGSKSLTTVDRTGIPLFKSSYPWTELHILTSISASYKLYSSNEPSPSRLDPQLRGCHQ